MRKKKQNQIIRMWKTWISYLVPVLSKCPQQTLFDRVLWNMWIPYLVPMITIWKIDLLEMPKIAMLSTLPPTLSDRLLSWYLLLDIVIVIAIGCAKKTRSISGCGKRGYPTWYLFFQNALSKPCAVDFCGICGNGTWLSIRA